MRATETLALKLRKLLIKFFRFSIAGPGSLWVTAHAKPLHLRADETNGAKPEELIGTDEEALLSHLCASCRSHYR